MNILVSNDDGYQAEGILCLAEHLETIAKVTVVAPDRNKSAASNSLTLKRPLRIAQAVNGFYYIDGTPADSVHLAITNILCDEQPDIVVAGINNGANLGDDVLYSGTVAAAIEGRFLGLPAMAVSLVGEQVTHYRSAAKAMLQILGQLKKTPLAANVILNINVPDLAYDEIKGIKATRLGRRHASLAAVETISPVGEKIFWVGPPGKGQDAGVGTDFHAIEQGYISITPMQLDLTAHSKLDSISHWAEQINL